MKRGLGMLAAMLPLAAVLVPMSVIQTAAAAATIHVTITSDVSPADCALGHVNPCKVS